MATDEALDFGLLARVHDLYRAALADAADARAWLTRRGLTDTNLLERFAIGFAPGTLKQILPQESDVRRRLRALGLITGPGRGREHLAGCVVIPLTDSTGRVIELVGSPIEGGALRRAGARGGVWNVAAMKLHTEVRLFADPLAAIASGDEAAVALAGDEWTDVTDQVFREHAPHHVGVENPRRRSGIVDHLKRLKIGERVGAEVAVENGFPATFGRRRYLVQAVTQDHPRQLRALVRAVGSTPGRFHLDSMNLYSAKDRTTFVREAALLFGEEPALIEADLGRIIALAEEHARRRPSSTNVDVSDEARAEAMEFLRDPKLTTRILEDFAALGLVGEEANKLAGYVVATSRKTDDPLSLLVLSRSAAGKSTLADAIAALMPPEDIMRFTRLTGQALFYQKDQSLRHKLLVVEEESGVTQAAYPLRILQSAKRLAVATPHGSREVEGPVAVIVTTTSTKLDDETRSRFLIASVDESREQTRRIFEIQRRREAGDLPPKNEIIRRHHALQRCLRPVDVVNPLARHLTFADHRLGTRREHSKYLALLRAVAFLRQEQHKAKDGVIQVEFEDIEIAHSVADQLFGQNLSDISPPGRRLLEALFAWRPKALFTRREAERATGWGTTQLWTYLKELTTQEWVIDKGGRPRTFEVAWDGREGRVALGLSSIGEIRRKFGSIRASFGRVHK